ncbi:selenocysteine-specific translation elongation factor [Actinomadura darangshiensis]|uniref:Selenocysteine-specific translation elongation factor n=1 Tax=Actinomadura darangshiensis TaxID=705336 RepID=A0A4R5C3H1_9ACTN|nr:selenocysteine-specific translation elongation factor [Actinomadura darangshiensis]TDD92936.1 selenocysteine-specific translation elongation factor [Actinomadura darangshiensis]
MHVIATAGHVDHGKSTLLRALTDMEPDRWAEERERGMTIDLGYAWTVLPSGETVAFVDVPGHHRFITNMLAGLGPVPAAMLVVAADEGWCRQTGEHLAALQALDVRRGLLVISRADLGDADLAAEEAHDYLAGTVFEDVETIAVSAVTGDGIEGLRAALGRLVAQIPAPPPSLPARLWVDRVFTIRGAGTVVTGTLGAGDIATGDELLLASSRRPVRVRKLESLKAAVERSTAVARVAVNVRGLTTREIRRGDALIAPSRWAPVECMDVRLVSAGEKVASRLILHIGSAAVPVRVRMLGADTARLALARPLALHIGERAILRDPGPQRIVAGLIILDTAPPPIRRRGTAKRASELVGMTGRPDPAGELTRRRVVAGNQLVAMGVLGPEAEPPGNAVAVGDWLIHQQQWDGWRAELFSVIDQWAADQPMAPGIPRDTAAQKLEIPDVRLVDALIAQAEGLVSDGGGVHREGVSATLPAQAEKALTVIIERLTVEPFTAPESRDLENLGLGPRVLATAVGSGRLLRVTDGIYLLPDAADLAVQRLATLPQPFTLSDGRRALDTTRRVAVPLFEMLDRAGRTRRVDANKRIVLSAPVDPPATRNI